MRAILGAVFTAVLCFLTSCGTPGAPQAPSLNLPKPVDDFSAVRKGDKVFLSWTPAHQTTDHENIRHPGVTEVCRGVRDFPLIRCDQKVGEVHSQIAHWTHAEQVPKATFTDTLPPELEQQNPEAFAIYAIDDLNPRGNSAGLSNQVEIPLAPTLPPPQTIEAQVTPEGPELHWTAPKNVRQPDKLKFSYRIYRRLAPGSAQPATAKRGELIVGEFPWNGEQEITFVDHSFEWEQKYVYDVTTVTQFRGPLGQPEQVEGDDSPSVTVDVHDIFPPAVPTGVQAVASGVGQKPFIDLTWAPNLESDLAGYNVFRHEEGAPVKINKELVKSPSFRDDNVLPGHRYYYSVSAVDLRGNESGRSAETSEAIPSK
ncbi:MAG TPA: fibronectin type III domain-containing protein [Terriglobales bacterium]|nr:fibronectin type III domain-containing protein [Terriglobales bacterium]